jgi:hypothetical protein
VVNETLPAATDSNDLNIALPKRFDYTNAYRLGADYFRGDHFKTTFQYTGDANEVASIYTLDVFYTTSL